MSHFLDVTMRPGRPPNSETTASEPGSILPLVVLGAAAVALSGNQSAPPQNRYLIAPGARSFKGGHIPTGARTPEGLSFRVTEPAGRKELGRTKEYNSLKAAGDTTFRMLATREVNGVISMEANDQRVNVLLRYVDSSDVAQIVVRHNVSLVNWTNWWSINITDLQVARMAATAHFSQLGWIVRDSGKLHTFAPVSVTRAEYDSEGNFWMTYEAVHNTIPIERGTPETADDPQLVGAPWLHDCTSVPPHLTLTYNAGGTLTGAAAPARYPDYFGAGAVTLNNRRTNCCPALRSTLPG